MTAAIKKPLSEVSHVERHPIFYTPASKKEILASILAYSLSDGTVAGRQGRATASFYSNEKDDLDEMVEVIRKVWPTFKGEARFKKGTKSQYDAWQIQFGPSMTKDLIESGAVVGKKVEQRFSVPDWVKKGSAEVKRAFVSTLWGAEGSTPRASNNKVPAMPVLSMSKRAHMFSTNEFIHEVAGLMTDLGVEVVVKETVIGKNLVSYIYVSSCHENKIRFFDEIGYTFCKRKQLLAWQWSMYLKSLLANSKMRRKRVVELRDVHGYTWPQVGEHMGISAANAKSLYHAIKKNPDAAPRAAHSFPGFIEWLEERWDEAHQVLRIKVEGRRCVGRFPVFNLRVSSPDHSYLLADGTNNFNSFNTMSGRVYYPFDRTIHTGKFEFNPELPIWIGQDFNIDPMSSVVMQPQPNGEVWIVDEIVLPSSNTAEVCDALERKFWRWQHNITIYPDPAGGQRQHARGETDLDIFRDRGFKKIKHKRKHPPIADRVNSVNSMLMTTTGKIRLKVNETCRETIAAFEQTLYKPGSRDVDKAAGVEHAADALGYCIEIEHPLKKRRAMGMSY